MSGRMVEDAINKRAETFVSCRVGLEINQFEPDLIKKLDQYNIGGPHGDFIVAPIVCPRKIHTQDLDEIRVLSDLMLPVPDWESKVAVSIPYVPVYEPKSEETFQTMLEHALYLPTTAVIIELPMEVETQQIMARIVNEKLTRKSARPLILFRVRLGMLSDYPRDALKKVPRPISFGSNSGRSDDSSVESGIDNGSPPAEVSRCIEVVDSTNHSDVELHNLPSSSDEWTLWNNMRRHLTPDLRIGLCLEIYKDLEFDCESLLRWTGEPIRILKLSCDRFVSQEGCRRSTRIVGRLKEFTRQIFLSNSLQTAFVIGEKANHDMFPYLEHLSNLVSSIDSQNPDLLRGWNDTLMIPLQPLSTNLDASTYYVFELDRPKYDQYQKAMIEALDYMMMKVEMRSRESIHLMVLGAGRGPLVDALLKAITSLKLRKKVKIYALDKNYSSVQALREKQERSWSAAPSNIDIKVIRADMRYWQADNKADLIATELLGSFSDNELSPECIDGTWRFSTPETISIPECYTSYIAPICSFRLHQEVWARRYLYQNERPFDQIYVVRLNNLYTIAEPKPLFTFEHRDLSKQPQPGCNRRHMILRFTTKFDTVCHGFAGYFAAKLFGSTTISTVPSFKTDSMDSWFPAFIPLEIPITMLAGTEMELSISRLDNDTHVWYNWAVTHPQKSRVHSMAGLPSAMSKLV